MSILERGITMNILTVMMAFVVLVVFVMAMDYGVKFFIEWIIDVFY